MKPGTDKAGLPVMWRCLESRQFPVMYTEKAGFMSPGPGFGRVQIQLESRKSIVKDSGRMAESNKVVGMMSGLR